MTKVNFKYPLDLGSNRENLATIRFRAKKLGFNVHLPTPSGIAWNTNVSYNDISLGIIDSFASKALEAYDKNPEKFQNAKDLFDKSPEVKGYVDQQISSAAGGDTLLKAAISRNVYNAFGLPLGGFSKLGPYANPAADYVQFKRRVAVNPATTINFGEVGIRSFTFNFKLIAQTEKEADEILDIIYHLDGAAHPEKRNDFMLSHPDTFDIDFYEGSSINDKIPKISECNIINFNYTMNSQASMFFNTKHAASWDISIGFKERRAKTRSDVLSLTKQQRVPRTTKQEEKTTVSNLSPPI